VSGCPDVAVLVVAKAPRPGAVKTRLAADLGDVGAARVAATALLDTLLVCKEVFDHRVLALAGELTDTGIVDTAHLRDEVAQWQVIGQSCGDLGRRLSQAHADANAVTCKIDGRPRRILQIGMDTPHVTAGQLENSAQTLCSPEVDAVLGPAADGGWWVCGTSDPVQAAALESVPMSRSDTGDRSLAALRATGARVAVVCQLQDLDTLDDAKAISTQYPSLHVSAELRAQGVR